MSYEDRLERFQTGLKKLIEENDIEVIPTLGINPSGIIAQITVIDMQNPAMLHKYGIKRKEEKKEEEPPANPLAN